MLPEVARRNLAEYCDGFVEPHIFGLAAAETLFRAAQKHGLKLRLHADQLSHSGAALLGVRMGAVSVDHLDQIEDEEIELLAESPTIAVLLPGSVYHLGLNLYPPARRLIESGVAVALATDFTPRQGMAPGPLQASGRPANPAGPAFADHRRRDHREHGDARCGA